MGVVFEARDENLERPVALKVIAPELAEDAEFRARFTREAQAQAPLDSRHVVQVYAHGEDDGGSGSRPSWSPTATCARC